LFPPVSEIKRRRRRLGLTQGKLAELSGVPQEAISRIETTAIREPSYIIVKKLFEALEAAVAKIDGGTNSELTAGQVMNGKIVSISSTDSIDKAWDLMKRHNFSQLPVIDSTGKMVGAVSENELAKIGSRELAARFRVGEVMTDAFPVVGTSKRLRVLRSLLLEGGEPAIIVEKRGRAIGIITKSDLIDAIYL
jgi:predicted transcriptional regulator